MPTVAPRPSPIRHRHAALTLATLCSALVSLGTAVGCSGRKAQPDAAAATTTGSGDRVHGLTKAQQAETLVKVGNETITVGDFAARLSEQSPYLRARYASPERRREFLDNMVRFELLAQEAHTKGYDRSDEVERTRKQMMIQAMMKAEFEDRVQLTDITDAEVRAYFESHRDEFDKPEQVRASHIVLRDRAAAQRVLTQVLAKRADIAFWRQTAERYNEDAETKDRFGDLRFFSRPAQRRDDEPVVPAAVAEAAFSLAQVGDIHPTLIQSPAGFHILKLTGKRAALHRTLEEASRPIRNRLWRERREQRVTDFIAGLRRDASVTIDEAALASLRVDIPEGNVPEMADPQGAAAQGAPPSPPAALPSPGGASPRP
jgi:peptidyl-prolyl cis-trans isomerase C